MNWTFGSTYKRVTGLKDLEASLARLDGAVAKRILDAEAKAALEPVAGMARSIARRTPTDTTPYDLGDPHLADRIIVGAAKPRPGCVSSAVVKIKKGGKEARRIARANRLMKKLGATKKTRQKMGLFLKNPRRTWHLVEYGSFNKRTGRRNKAYPFIRPAVDARLEPGLMLYRDNMKRRIERAARRA